MKSDDMPLFDLFQHKGTENFDVSPMDAARVLRFVEWLAKEIEQVP